MKTGWIFRIKGKPGVYSSGYGESLETIPITMKLSGAIVVPTRKAARKVKHEGETLLRVELSPNGKPKRIISRG